MAKSLKDLFEVYRPKAKDEADFVDKHVTIKHPDRNGNGDDVFKASNVKKSERKKERHGYEPGEDEKVYEEIDSDLEDELKATRQTKKSITDAKKKYGVKEEVENIEELSTETLDSYRTKARNQIIHTRNKDNEKTEKRLKGYTKASQKIQKNFVKGMDEQVELEEGTMKLSKVHIVHHHDHPAAREFAKNYTAGMKGDHREGGPSAADEKAADKFHQRYSGMRTREGFAGSGTHIYHDHKTGAKWKVDRVPNGKTFYGTDHIITHHIPDMRESVEDEMYFTEEEEMVIRSLAGAAEELGEELDFETLCGLAEEVLSELSPATLRRYRMKSKSIADNEGPLNYREKGRELAGRKTYGGRMAGIEKARVMAKEETELDEVKIDRAYKIPVKPPQPWKDGKIYKEKPVDPKKLDAVGKKIASIRGMKEEVDQIDELSRKTLGSYAVKASRQSGANLAGAVAGGMAPDSNQNDVKKMSRTYAKRAKGVEMAINKLTKEDIINRAIDRYVPEDIELPSLEERLVDKLDEQNIPEQHIHVLLSMFESLNEQNQMRMLERVETVEGINSLLDFAISNRGE